MSVNWSNTKEIVKNIIETSDRLRKFGYNDDDVSTMVAEVISRCIQRYYNNYGGIGDGGLPVVEIPGDIKKYVK